MNVCRNDLPPQPPLLLRLCRRDYMDLLHLTRRARESVFFFFSFSFLITVVARREGMMHLPGARKRIPLNVKGIMLRALKLREAEEEEWKAVNFEEEGERSRIAEVNDL